MTGASPIPNAATISIADALKLLDEDFKELAVGVAKGEYALWLGSGISRERVPDLRIVVRCVLDHLSDGARAEAGDGPFTVALTKAVGLALTNTEKKAVDLTNTPGVWPNVNVVVDRLVSHYSQLLDIRILGKKEDYLLWEVVDVRDTYANDNLEPDCEHLAVAVLALEGVFPTITSANWDGLVEKALAGITAGNPDILAVYVRADDIRGANRRSHLYKYHGCAVLAKKDEAKYREYIVGRQSQIVDWPLDDRFAVMRNRLEGFTSTSRTLMVGLSAQDSNIQAIFAKGRALMNWPYPSHPPAYVFAEEDLGADQETLLKCVYKDAFVNHQLEIETGARIPAYGKSLLSALVLSVLARKAVGLVGLVDAPHLSAVEREKLAIGVNSLRDTVAATAGTSSSDKLEFMKALIAGMTRDLAMFRGDTAAHAARVYGPLGVFPVGQQSGDPELQMSGMPELAVFTGLAGIGHAEDQWHVAQATGDLAEGTLTITSPASPTPQKLFLVSSSEALSRLVLDGIVNEDDPMTIVTICSAPVSR